MKRNKDQLHWVEPITRTHLNQGTIGLAVAAAVLTPVDPLGRAKHRIGTAPQPPTSPASGNPNHPWPRRGR